MAWARLPVDRITATWNRRSEWDARNLRGKHMDIVNPCPVCGPPNVKGVRRYIIGDGKFNYVRLRRLDTCHCVLTPMQDAEVVRLARFEAREKEGQPISADQPTARTTPVM